MILFEGWKTTVICYIKNGKSDFCPFFSETKIVFKKDFHLLFLQKVWHYLRPLTAMCNYFVSWYWHLTVLGQLQHWAVMSQFSGDYNVVPCRGEHNNQANLFPPGRHLCLLSMTLCPHFHVHRLREVLKNILKLYNKKLLKIGE